MILTTRDLILNGTRTYITFNTELDNTNGLTWSLSLVDPHGNCSSTTGYITLELPKPAAPEPKPVATEPKPVATEPKPVATEPKPVTTEPKPVATEPKPVTTEPKPVASETKPITTKEDLIHCTNIKKFLIEVETSIGFTPKRNSCIELLNYISNNALEFVNKYLKFKETTIDKCWEIKMTNWDDSELCSACDNLLNTLNVSWVPPSYVDAHKRLELLRKIFDKKNLILTKYWWNKYNDWSKNVKGLNRYKKMMEFININKENILVKA
jgi:hypothetical protein